MKIQESIALAAWTTFGIGGPARRFVVAHHTADVAEAVATAAAEGWPLFVLGGGSNLLVSDDGFDGLVLQIALRGVRESQGDGGAVRFDVAAGEPWDQFVAASVERGLAGLECLSGIPGSTGGTPIQNVGAYGQEASEVIRAVRVYDRTTRSELELSAAECRFGYRASRFNGADAGRFIVLSVHFELSPGPARIAYRDLADTFRGQAEPPSLRQVRAAVCDIRHRKGMLIVPGEADCRSAGSFFKNPVLPEEDLERLAEAAGVRPPRFEAGSGQVKVPAAWLIEKSGFSRGYRRGAAAISSRHTLALVNTGGATAGDVVALAREVRDGVQARFGVALRAEPVMLGFAGPSL